MSSKLLSSIRANFPRIDADASGRHRIFFENAAGSLVLQQAAAAEAKARIDCSANVDAPSWESKRNDEVILDGRRDVGDFLNAPDTYRVVSGESATSLLFHLSYAISKELSGKENVVLTNYEHYANISPWLELERRGLVKDVRFAKFDPKTGLLDLSHLESLMDKNTRVISMAGVSNVLGSKTPLDEVLRIAKRASAYTVMDAVHTVAHVPIDVQKTPFDFVLFSAYKLFSRRGSFMCGRQDLLRSLKPYKVLPAPEEPPSSWEMGTRDQSLFASISAVMEYFAWLGTKVKKEQGMARVLSGYTGRRLALKAALTWIEKYERELSVAMLGGTDGGVGLPEIAGVEVYGITDVARVQSRVPTFTFNIRGADPLEVAKYLWDKHAIAVLAEDHGGFYSKTLNTYGKSIAVRASPVHFNTVEEVAKFLQA
ncbi:MAG TPA: aminotransferase class V-fold PLP-dependent enzyme, partial [Nitrososphaerales archaeon]|nr:aminotransferase class V-fold PLP-dependent enzyme [Nitrososphaerales archaeon]